MDELSLDEIRYLQVDMKLSIWETEGSSAAILRTAIRRHKAKRIRETELAHNCRDHGSDNCKCRPSNCCSRYTHGCGPMHHKFFDPDMNGA